MAKRFTDTDKWKKPFIRGLPTPYKLLWFYILDDCNHAGVWEVDIEVAEIRTGEKFSILYALEIFGDRVQKISENKWFLPDFISFQYGELNEKNRLHLSVINILNKYEIKDLTSPLQGVKEQYKDKDKDKVTVFENEKQKFANDFRWKEKFCRDKNLSMPELEKRMAEFISDIELREDFKELKELKSHFTNTFNKQKNGHKPNQTSGKHAGALQLIESLKQDFAAGRT
jgi:hypothetical protein